MSWYVIKVSRLEERVKCLWGLEWQLCHSLFGRSICLMWCNTLLTMLLVLCRMPAYSLEGLSSILGFESNTVSHNPPVKI